MKRIVFSPLSLLLFMSCTSITAATDKAASFSFTEIKNQSSTSLIDCVFIKSTDGTKLAYYPYIARNPIASLVFVHGGGAYSGAGYQYLAASLAGKYNVNVYLLDIRGHGNSEGPRGDSPSARQVYSDIEVIVKQVEKENLKLPIFLGGHSSGAGLVLNYTSHVQDESISGYFFLSPFWGYKSKTDRANSISFSDVKVPLFVLNGMSFGLLFGHSKAVFFNYPKEVLQSQPLLIPSITVNLSLALTPNNPVDQFRKINKPFGLFIGADDELLDSGKVMAYAGLPVLDIVRKSTYQVVENENHLSILMVADRLIGEAIFRRQ